MPTIEDLQNNPGRLRQEMAVMRAQVALTPNLIGDAAAPKQVLSRRKLLRAANAALGLAATVTKSCAVTATGSSLQLRKVQRV